MSRKKGSDNFGFKDLKSTKGINPVEGIQGANSAGSLKNVQPIKYRFRPPLDSKNQSVVSNYQYASLWARWRRGYELSMYGRQTYDAFKYSGVIARTFMRPPLLEGFATFMYPSKRSDAGAHVCCIRPKGTFSSKPRDGNPLQRVLNCDVQLVMSYPERKDTYLVVFDNKASRNGNFGAPMSEFVGEVLSTQFSGDGNIPLNTYDNYTCVGVGFWDTFAELFVARPVGSFSCNALLLSTSINESWSVVNNKELVVPALNPPKEGDVYDTTMRVQCTCQDFLSRENFNFWENAVKQRYPYTGLNDLSPGIYDAGTGYQKMTPQGIYSSNRVFLGSTNQNPRIPSTVDNPGIARTFGFIYLNNIYNIPEETEASYSDANTYYYAPRWCKHIYASYWELKLTEDMGSEVNPWVIPEPSDELLDERYRHYFEEQLKKEYSIKKLEEKLEFFWKYSPTYNGQVSPVLGRQEFTGVNPLANYLVRPDVYNVFTKTMNLGSVNNYEISGGTPGFINTNSMQVAGSFQVYDPFRNPTFTSDVTLDGGSYEDGADQNSFERFIESENYENGAVVPSILDSTTTIDGGVY